MKRVRTCSVGDVGLALLVSLGLGSWAFGQECTNDAGAGDQAEGETCIETNEDDTTDYGCNDLPGLFITLSTGDFTNDAHAICGGGSTLLANASCPVSCDLDEDCPAGATCVDGACDPVCLGPLCDVDADCPGGTCLGDSNPGDGTADGNCFFGETCVEVEPDVFECQGGDEPSVDSRDTDWYLIPQSVLSDFDFDSNGVVELNAQHLNAELDLLIYMISLTRDPGGQPCDVDADCPSEVCVGDPNPGDGNADGTCEEQCDASVFSSPHGCIALGGQACDENGDCHSGDCVGDPIPGDGNPEGTCAPANQTKSELLIIDDHPDGVAVWTSTGFCSGAGNWGDPDYFCSTNANDYILEISFSEASRWCAPGATQGPCNEESAANRPGCEDPSCCQEVCEVLAYCCLTIWDEGCANTAIDRGCAPAVGGPVRMATGPDEDQAVDGYLRVKADPMGAYADGPNFGGTTDGGDWYNPAGAPDMRLVGFSTGFFFYIPATNQRELLANNTDWQAVGPPDIDEFGQDESLDWEITVISIETDTNADTVTDQLNSQFRVFGAGVDLTFDLQQNVANPEGAIATLTQVLSITNILPDPVTFNLQRQNDADLLWVGDATDDEVGTTSNGQPGMWVTQQEDGDPTTAVCMTSSHASAYCGAKQGVNPINDPELCPDYDFGTDTQEWVAYGLPDCWQNHIALVGYNLNGSSGNPAGADDAHIVLSTEITVPGGPAPPTVVTFLTTYGQNTPYGSAPACPCDCATPADQVVNVVDFLALLAQWGGTGSCDCAQPPDGVVNVVDFLAILADWGDC